MRSPQPYRWATELPLRMHPSTLKVVSMKPCIQCKRPTGATAILKPDLKEVPLCPNCYEGKPKPEAPKTEQVWNGVNDGD